MKFSYYMLLFLIFSVFIEISDQIDGGRSRRSRRRRRRRRRRSRSRSHQIKEEEKEVSKSSLIEPDTELRSSSKKIKEEKKKVSKSSLIEPDTKFKLPDQFCSCARSKPEVNREWELRNSRKRARVKRSSSKSSRSKDLRDRIVGGYDASYNKEGFNITNNDEIMLQSQVL